VVVKFGSSLFYAEGRLDFGVLNDIASQVALLAQEGVCVTLVSSGAIALGMHTLGLKARPRELSVLQAAAAIGQNELMTVYRRVFKEKGLACGQVLLTWDDFNERSRYLNAKNTLLALLKLGVVPVINENDTVSTDEIKFGDNDRLSALVAGLISADILLMLTDVPGLLAEDKKTVIGVVEEITPRIKNLACPTEKKTCVGGMVTKIEAAREVIRHAE